MNTHLLDVDPRQQVVYGLAYTVELGLYALALFWAARLGLGLG